jgi:hypothetical protein
MMDRQFVTVQTSYMILGRDKHTATGGLGGASEPASGRTSSAPLSLNVYDSSINFGDLCYNASVDVLKIKGSVVVIYMIVVL